MPVRPVRSSAAVRRHRAHPAHPGRPPRAPWPGAGHPPATIGSPSAPRRSRHRRRPRRTARPPLPRPHGPGPAPRRPARPTPRRRRRTLPWGCRCRPGLRSPSRSPARRRTHPHRAAARRHVATRTPLEPGPRAGRARPAPERRRRRRHTRSSPGTTRRRRSVVVGAGAASRRVERVDLGRHRSDRRRPRTPGGRGRPLGLFAHRALGLCVRLADGVRHGLPAVRGRGIADPQPDDACRRGRPRR